VKWLQQCDTFDDIYVKVSSKEEILNGTAYPQPRRIAFGVVQSQGYHLYGVPVAKLFHYSLRCHISKEICIPMPKYIYRLTKMVWERIQGLLPSDVRDIPPNPCQKCFYHSDFKSFLGKHQDNKVLANGKSRFISGTPIVSVSLNHPMNFEVHYPVDEQTNEAKHPKKSKK
jgi:hypothetical protein